MPKVTEAYKIQKKNKIISAAASVLERKPLYLITMLDIIKEAGLSKGGIYLYYSGLDELLVDTINHISMDWQKFDLSEIKLSGNPEDSIILLFQKLGTYIESSPPLIGKVRFELQVYIMNNPQKADQILPKLTLQNFGSEFMEVLMVLLHSGREQNKFSEDIESDIFMNNIAAYIDGMTDMFVRNTVYCKQALAYSLEDYFEGFARNLLIGLQEK